LTTEFFRARPDWTVGECLEGIRTGSAELETVYAAYIVDAEGVLVKAISLRDLVTADPLAPILSVGTTRKSFSVTVDASRDEVWPADLEI
jgi:magnesium transporter